jgi:hypothetical protein
MLVWLAVQLAVGSAVHGVAVCASRQVEKQRQGYASSSAVLQGDGGRVVAVALAPGSTSSGK